MMQISDINNPGERKKLIWALVLGLVAIVFLWWTFFGFGSSKPRANRNTQSPVQNPTTRAALNPEPIQRPDGTQPTDLEQLRPVSYPGTPPTVAEATRNIFVYYEKPPAPVVEAPVPVETPTPPPPVLIAAVSPSSVFARTDAFAFEVTGDKFTPDVRITVDGRELPTRFVSAQQVTTTVPAEMIANAGGRQVLVRSPDGKLYSNPTTLNVNPPPTPNYTYIGIIGTQRRLDTAILMDKGSREVLNAQRGDVLGGRFRLTSISEKEVVMTDTSLKIRHTLPMTTEQTKGFSPQTRPTPKVDSEDDEP